MALYAGYESAVHAHRRNSTYAREIDASGAELEPVGRGRDPIRGVPRLGQSPGRGTGAPTS